MDPGIFALIIPEGTASSLRVAEHPENAHYFVPSKLTARTDRGSRDATPASGSDEDEDEDEIEIGEYRLPAIYNKDRLVLRFDDMAMLKDPTEGWQFGYSTRTADIMICLPGTAGVSRNHFAVSITPELRVRFHQRTAQTTKLVFSSEEIAPHEIHPKQGDKFFISLAPSEPQYWTKVDVSVGRGSHKVKFLVVFPNHTLDATSEYYRNIQQWVQDSAAAVPPMAGLGIDSTASTVAPSRQSRSPTPPRFSGLCYQRTIGAGAFGLVEMLVDLTTGDVAARKTLLKYNRVEPPVRARITASFWNEARLMQQNPHPHIIQLLAIQQNPVPSILMPYYPHGNMFNRFFYPDQKRSAFRQLLIVLNYLHGRNVAHRDLKPENILLASLDPIHIVVSDFGLSKEAVPGNLMTTFCGTKLYCAPDVCPLQRRAQSARGYWMSVDIWSAGVIMLEWTFGRPSTRGIVGKPDDVMIELWKRAILWAVRTHDLENPGDRVVDLLKHMLVLDPQKRYQASECLERGCANGLFRRTRAGDVICADDDDPDDPNPDDLDDLDGLDDSGSKTPRPSLGGEAGEADEGLSFKTITTKVATGRAGENYLRAPSAEPSAGNRSGLSAMELFMNFDLIPSGVLAPEVDKEQDAEEAPQDEQEEEPAADVPDVSYVLEKQPTSPTAAGTKRPRKANSNSNSNSSASKSKSKSTSTSSSKKARVPPKKRGKSQPDNTDDAENDSVMWADVLGSHPRLSGVPSDFASGFPRSMSPIGITQDVLQEVLQDDIHDTQAADTPVMASSFSSLQGASNYSTRAA